MLGDLFDLIGLFLCSSDNKALYVVSTSETQMYELVAGTSSERKM